MTAPKLLTLIQTTWTDIRVGLYQHEDGRFQFVEECLKKDGAGNPFWTHLDRSKIYDDLKSARAAMLEDYCERVEDDLCPIEPSTVTWLEPPIVDTARSGFDDPEFGKGAVRIMIRADLVGKISRS